MKNRVSINTIISICLLSVAAFAQREVPIAEIQGSKNASALVGQKVSATGVVTARIGSGFFLQTPDGKTDANPETSDGIFIFTKDLPPLDILVGNIVTVSGTVEEYRNRNDTHALTITEISHRLGQDTYKVLSKDNPLPTPLPLTTAEFAPNTLDQLERFEGMRVAIAELAAVSPTNGRVDLKNASGESDGSFFAVVKGMPRPFREPGMDIRNFYASADREKLKRDYPKMKVFDANPEVFRVDTDEQYSAVPLDFRDILKDSRAKFDAQFRVGPLEVTANSRLTNLTGVMHYAFGRYTVLADFDKKQAPSNTIKPSTLPAPTDRQFSVAGMNLENFFDEKDDPDIKEDIVTPEAFQRRLKKVSAAVRDYMAMPDVIGMVEAENLDGLKRLADRINKDAVAAGKPDPKYEALLVEGNDGRGIDNGFLVKTSRIKVIETKQLGKADKYKNPNTNDDNFLNDRPPLMLRASILDNKTNQPFEFTVVVNHLKSFLGYDDPKQQDNVRLKKKLQAEFLAKFVQERQKADPKEKIMLIGDFNAYQFNDAIVDVIGTIKGKPASKDEVMNPSDDLVDPDMIDLVDVINADQRYSYRFDGNAQVLDHVIITDSLKGFIHGFGYARMNTDFPETYRADENRPERFSDHDAAVAYFNLDEKVAKPAATPAPSPK